MATPTVSATSQVSARTGIVTDTTTTLSENLYRSGLIIQNLGTSALFVKFGSGATASDFDIALKGGTASDDGLGGNLSYDVLSYTGIISVAGSSPRWTATQF